MDMKLDPEKRDFAATLQGVPIPVTGAEEQAQRIWLRLAVPRGSFRLDPELGSRLYQLGREKPSAREALALQYVTEALAQEKDLAVLRTALTQEGAGAAVLQVELEWRGAPLAIQVDLTM